MRIISGKAKSLPLKTIPGENTRPTTDRIKETLFNMLQPHLMGAVFLDLFAGSGGIGLEAISRGASHAVFVEQNRKAAACIRENIHFTKFNNESTLLCMDVIAALKQMEGNVCFDLVFMDPPYDKLLEKQVLDYLQKSTLITKDTLIVVESSLGTDFSYLEGYQYELIRRKDYKTNAHIFIRRLV